MSAISLNARDLDRAESAQKFNAINTRTDVLEQAMDEVWGKNRFVGGGLRYFANPVLAIIAWARSRVVLSEIASDEELVPSRSRLDSDVMI